MLNILNKVDTMNKKVNQSLKRVLKNIDFENDISKIDTDKNQYYESVEKYGITKKMNDIIDNFYKDTNTYSNLYNKLDLKIGIICDEFMYYSLKDTADFIYIPFTENMEVNKDIDLLLVVSSWRGLDHSWDYVANPKGRVRKALIDLINQYKSESIKTVFYSKEDPVSYKQYLSIAQECDYILTSAKEMIDEYKRDTGNNNVDYLEFGINPLYHNPIGKDMTDKKLSHIVTFAGSWMVRFPRRNKDALELFNGVNKSGYSLSIVDRQFERKMERYHFPHFLIKNISETIPHERLMKLHKATKWGINLNSVQDSNTMFANRVYELQAMGNIVISNYNKGVHLKFPNIILSNNSKDVEITLREMTLNEQKRLIAEGLAEVMLNHTSFHRMGKLANLVGFEYKLIKPRILIVGNSERCREICNKQTYKECKYIDLNEFKKNTSVIKSFDYLVFLSNNIEYGRRYIENLLSTFAYTNADIVTMNKDFYKYTDKNNFIKTSSMISSEAYNNFNEEGSQIIYFNIPRTEMKSIKELVLHDENKKADLTILIPVSNNEERLLENKSLRNLNDINADIILVTYNNPGTDTVHELEHLKYKNPRISHLEFNDVKNKHIALNKSIQAVKTRYLSFLLPGNEISKKTILKVIKLIKKENIDLIIGNQNNLIDNDFLFNLKEHDYSVLSNNLKTESVIYSTNFLKENDIVFNEHVKTFNNLFILTALSLTDRVYRMNNPFSIKLNTLTHSSLENSKVLEEYRIIEEEQYKILSRLEIINEYSNEVFPEVFLKKYFPLFKKATKNDKVECLVILESIFQLYNQHYNSSNEKLNELVDMLFG